MPTKQFTVGSSNCSPVAGQTRFIADFLESCFVNFILIDNIPINQLEPNPQFRHSYVERFVDISHLTFVTGGKIIFDITPVKPC